MWYYVLKWETSYFALGLECAASVRVFKNECKVFLYTDESNFWFARTKIARVWRMMRAIKSHSKASHLTEHSFRKLLPSALSSSLTPALVGSKIAPNCNTDVSDPNERSVSWKTGPLSSQSRRAIYLDPGPEKLNWYLFFRRCLVWFGHPTVLGRCWSKTNSRTRDLYSFTPSCFFTFTFFRSTREPEDFKYLSESFTTSHMSESARKIH